MRTEKLSQLRLVRLVLRFVSTSNKPFSSTHVLSFFSFLRVRAFILLFQGFAFFVLGGRKGRWGESPFLSSHVLYRPPAWSHQLG